MEELRYKKKEYFLLLLLNTKNQVISREEISVGSLSYYIVNPREIFTLPIKKSAASIILVHNHPSGDPTLLRMIWRNPATGRGGATIGDCRRII